MSSLEQSIRAKDILYLLLRSWKLLLLFALSAALLVSGLLVLRKSLSVGQDQKVELTDAEVEAIVLGLYSDDPRVISLEKERVELEDWVISLEERLESSLYLAIDEQAQPLIQLRVEVDPEEPREEDLDTWEQRHYQLMIAFSKISKSDPFFKYLNKVMDISIPPAQLSNLLDCQLDDDLILHCTLTAPQADTVHLMAEAAKDYFQKEIRETISVPYLYDIRLFADPLKVVANPAIGEEKERLSAQLVSDRQGLEEIVEEIDLYLSQALEEARMAKEEELEAEKEATPSLTRSMIKYLFPAMVLGALLATLLVLYRATSQGLVFSAEEMSLKLGLFYLGSLYPTPKKSQQTSKGKDLGARMENRIYRDRGLEGMTVEDQMAYLAFAVKSIWTSQSDPALEEKGGKLPAIALIGDLDEGPVEALISYFQDQSAGAEFEGAAGQPVMFLAPSTAAGLERLAGAGGAILLVRSRKSRLGKILRDYGLAARLGIPLLGVIGIEGAF